MRRSLIYALSASRGRDAERACHFLFDALHCADADAETLGDIQARLHKQCPLLGVKRTSKFQGAMSAFDPKRSYAVLV
jgi:hypothetical protein